MRGALVESEIPALLKVRAREFIRDVGGVWEQARDDLFLHDSNLPLCFARLPSPFC